MHVEEGGGRGVKQEHYFIFLPCVQKLVDFFLMLITCEDCSFPLTFTREAESIVFGSSTARPRTAPASSHSPRSHNSVDLR